MKYAISESGLYNALPEVYGAITAWLDKQILAGKITETSGNRVNRDDIGELNARIEELYKSHRFEELEVKS